ncbi:hypothetical protein [Erythrobacter sp. EC-HK427]|uniref:hypothetical protein n=1 Tax=Erythrobacter sp. EC-HK427 TaxID=2038396 RepID=UPI001259CC95|nr:hypothetical protein [Erythrobacter sp. EC-HK427]VVT05796.1 conserved hypothetical protein [Erythrobacter sp. EC-HK427]
MTNDTIFISAVVIALLLALANAWRGAVLIRSGNETGGRRALVLGLSMLMLAGFAVYLRPI